MKQSWAVAPPLQQRGAAESGRKPLRRTARRHRVALSVEQLKQVTILFADFDGFNELTETLDAEETSDIMREMWNRIDTVVMDHGGMVERHMGGQVMALWGVGIAHEDDPEHAVRAALALHAR